MARNITSDCIDGGQIFSLCSEQLAAIVLRKAEGPNTAQKAVYFDLQERLSVWYADSTDRNLGSRHESVYDARKTERIWNLNGEH